MGILYSRAESTSSQGGDGRERNGPEEEKPIPPPKARAGRLAVLRDSSLTSIPHEQTSLGKKITDWVSPGDKSGEFKRQASSFRNHVSKEAGAKFPLEKGRYHLYVSYACPWVRRSPTLQPSVACFFRPAHRLTDVDSRQRPRAPLSPASSRGSRILFPIPLSTGTWANKVSRLVRSLQHPALFRAEVPSRRDTEAGGRLSDTIALLPGWRFATAEDKDAAGDNVIPDPVEGHEGFTHLRQIYFESDPDYAGRFTVPVLYDKVQKTIVNNESSEILRMFSTEVSSFPSRTSHRVVASC